MCKQLKTFVMNDLSTNELWKTSLVNDVNEMNNNVCMKKHSNTYKLCLYKGDCKCVVVRNLMVGEGPLNWEQSSLPNKL